MLWPLKHRHRKQRLYRNEEPYRRPTRVKHLHHRTLTRQGRAYLVESLANTARFPYFRLQ